MERSCILLLRFLNPASPSIVLHTALAALILGTVSCKSNRPGGIPSSGHLAALIVESENYLSHHRVETSTGVCWKVQPELDSSTYDISLYSGVPGIVLFYLELYHAFGDSSYLKEALAGTDYIIEAIRKDGIGPFQPGLYTGLAGAAFIFGEVYRTTGDKNYFNAALSTIDTLIQTAGYNGGGLHWDHMNDLVYGSAGIGLTMLDLAKKLQSDRMRDIARSVADGLIAEVSDSTIGYRWNIMPSVPQYMDNFSHGNAGIAFFLARMYQETHNPAYLRAAIEATYILDTLQNEKGFVSHHMPGGEELYYLGWCHGPPGTSKLYLLLYQLTGQEKWIERVKKTSETMLSLELATNRFPGLWNNLGRCCGDAGIAEHFLRMHILTGKSEYQKQLWLLTQRIIEQAVRDDNYVRWKHAENRVNPQELSIQTGLMQGSAGIGLWLLKLWAFENGQNTFVSFPDDLPFDP